MSTLEHPEGDPGAGPDPDQVDAEGPVAPAAEEPPSADLPAAAPGSAEAPTSEGAAEAEGVAEPGDGGGAAGAAGGEGAPEPETGEGAIEATEGSSLERESSEDPLDQAQISVDPGEVRHAPRFGRFATIGGLLGLVLGLMTAALARYGEPGMVMDPWGLGILMAAIFTPVGILIGCVLALLSDRRSRGRSSGN